MYEVIARSKRYGFKESWGKFKTLKECLKYVEQMNRTLGSSYEITWEEVE